MAKILVIDDEPAFADFAKIIIESMGHSVATCLEATDALESALRFRPDLIITDMNMPEANGLEVIAQLKARPETRFVPILLASASTDNAHRTEALKLGAVYAIVKPLQTSVLKALLERLLPPGAA